MRAPGGGQPLSLELALQIGFIHYHWHTFVNAAVAQASFLMRGWCCCVLLERSIGLLSIYPGRTRRSRGRKGMLRNEHVTGVRGRCFGALGVGRADGGRRGHELRDVLPRPGCAGAG
jgi:hypothetical protein